MGLGVGDGMAQWQGVKCVVKVTSGLRSGCPNRDGRESANALRQRLAVITEGRGLGRQRMSQLS